MTAALADHDRVVAPAHRASRTRIGSSHSRTPRRSGAWSGSSRHADTSAMWGGSPPRLCTHNLLEKRSLEEEINNSHRNCGSCGSNRIVRGHGRFRRVDDPWNNTERLPRSVWMTGVVGIPSTFRAQLRASDPTIHPQMRPGVSRTSSGRHTGVVTCRRSTSDLAWTSRVDGRRPACGVWRVAVTGRPPGVDLWGCIYGGASMGAPCTGRCGIDDGDRDVQGSRKARASQSGVTGCGRRLSARRAA